MAIKISGTTVIGDDRSLQNVTGLKTVGGESILGSGDLTSANDQTVGTVQYTGFSSTYYTSMTIAGTKSGSPTNATVTSIYNATAGGYALLLANIPQVPATAVVTHHPFTFSAVTTSYVVPAGNDQGGPYSVPYVYVVANVRTEYRTIA